MKSTLSLYVACVLFFSCKNRDIPSGIPDCVAQLIKDVKKGPVWSPPASLYTYQYKGETVYYFPPRCCDRTSELYDQDCELVCSPDGGHGGTGDGRCSDFIFEASNPQLLWEDDRD